MKESRLDPRLLQLSPSKIFPLWFTFAYDLPTYLANILSPLTGKSEYTVTNSAHFVSTVSNETILDNEIMVSFDVESLFTNVPIDAAVQAALQKLENDPNLADRTMLTPAQIADLLTFVLRSTYFLYNGFMSKKTAPPWGVQFPLLLPTSTWRVSKNRR